MVYVTGYGSEEHLVMGSEKMEMKKDKQKKHEKETKPCTVFV
jgi:hypothetical protein